MKQRIERNEVKMLTDRQIINSMFLNSCFIEESMDKSRSFEIKDFINKKKICSFLTYVFVNLPVRKVSTLFSILLKDKK